MKGSKNEDKSMKIIIIDNKVDQVMLLVDLVKEAFPRAQIYPKESQSEQLTFDDWDSVYTFLQTFPDEQCILCMDLALREEDYYDVLRGLESGIIIRTERKDWTLLAYTQFSRRIESEKAFKDAFDGIIEKGDISKRNREGRVSYVKDAIEAALRKQHFGRAQVFFSYSHKDKKWLERFQVALKPLVRGSQLSVWDDTRIKAGDVWRDEIKQALASAKVAVLLVSMNFLESDFIDKHELPPLLEAAQKEGLRILLVVVGHSLFEETELGRYQAVNDPSKPLASLSAANREKEIVKICREIKAATTSTEGVRFAALTTQPETGEEPLEFVKKDFFQLHAQKEKERTIGNIKILLLSANLVNTPPMQLDQEVRDITQKVRESMHRDLVWIVPARAVHPGDLLQAMNEHEPHVVQFSGHGSGEEGIFLSDERGNAKTVGGDALTALFDSTQINVQVVVLNACYSKSQAEAIAEAVPCVIGMKETIGDRAASVFAAAFYGALGFRRSVEVAFKQGLAALKLEGIKQSEIPSLITRSSIKASKIVPLDRTRR